MPHVVVNYMYYYFLHCDSALNFFIVWFKSVVLNEKVSLIFGGGLSYKMYLHWSEIDYCKFLIKFEELISV